MFIVFVVLCWVELLFVVFCDELCLTLVLELLRALEWLLL